MALYGYVHDSNGWIDVLGWHAIQVEYASTDLSKMAYEYRANNNIGNGRNVAVFEYLDKNGEWAFEIAHSKGKHSERIIIDSLKNKGIEDWQVNRIYSELEPCTIPGGKCKQYISLHFPDAEVTYSFEYGDTKESRTKGVKELKKNNKH